MATIIYDEAELFGVCLLLGMVLALLYDGIRIIRLFFRHKNWLIDLEDLLFWIFTAWFAFSTLFTYNQGRLRGYAFLGMFLGVLVYTITLSRGILFLVGKMLPYWRKIESFLKRPFIFIYEFIIKILKNMMSQVKMAIKGR